jgi:urease
MVEGTFPTGSYLVTVHHPISTDDGDLSKALYGSFLPIPDQSIFPMPKDEEYESTKMPGAVVCIKAKVVLNEGRKRIKLKVTSKGDRPIQARSRIKVTNNANYSRLAHIITLSKQIRNLNLIV